MLFTGLCSCLLQFFFLVTQKLGLSLLFPSHTTSSPIHVNAQCNILHKSHLTPDSQYLHSLHHRLQLFPTSLAEHFTQQQKTHLAQFYPVTIIVITTTPNDIWLTRIFMIMLAVVTAFSVEALNTFSSSSASSVSFDFSTDVSVFDDGSSAIFLQNSVANTQWCHSNLPNATQQCFKVKYNKAKCYTSSDIRNMLHICFATSRTEVKFYHDKHPHNKLLNKS